MGPPERMGSAPQTPSGKLCVTRRPRGSAGCVGEGPPGQGPACAWTSPGMDGAAEVGRLPREAALPSPVLTSCDFYAATVLFSGRVGCFEKCAQPHCCHHNGDTGPASALRPGVGRATPMQPFTGVPRGLAFTAGLHGGMGATKTLWPVSVPQIPSCPLYSGPCPGDL